MSKLRIIGLIAFMALLVSCRSTSSLTSVSSTASSSEHQDSSYVRETASVDTLKISGDSVSVTLPLSWAVPTVKDSSAPIRMIDYPDLNSVSKSSGRATVTVTRTGSGLKVTASCDSIQALLISKEKEIYNLKSDLKSLREAETMTSEKATVVPFIPAWIIIALVISAAINVFFAYRTLRKRLL